MEKKTSSFTDDNDSQEELANYDGGFGWIIVGAAFSVQFFVLGMMNNYGILFTKLLEEFKESKQATCKFHWTKNEVFHYGFLQ